MNIANYNEEVRQVRKAKRALKAYSALKDWDKAVDELMKLNELCRWSRVCERKGLAKYIGRWTHGLLNLIPPAELLKLLDRAESSICFGNLWKLASNMKIRRASVVYKLANSERSIKKFQYISECLARQPYVNPIVFLPDLGIKINWLTETEVETDAN